MFLVVIDKSFQIKLLAETLITKNNGSIVSDHKF